MDILKTKINNVRNVSRYTIGEGSLADLPNHLMTKRKKTKKQAIFFIDQYFKNSSIILKFLKIENCDKVIFVPTENEPTTNYIDDQVMLLKKQGFNKPCAIIGIGGGITMDVAKAVSNLLTNEGKAEDYQGWDLLKNPGIFKIAVPTISGTGAEATRTCVMTNKDTGLKLGMNSDFTVFDQIIMDPKLSSTVPKNQYFYTGMDAYIHCIESKNGNYRNAVGDAFSSQTIHLCREIFSSKNMMSDTNRSKLMVASYLGGCAIATSYVGLVHPFSAGLSVVLGLNHCIANCITMRAMSEFYPYEYDEFWTMADKQNVEIPKSICDNLNEEEFDKLYKATIIHEKPLTNALGDDFRNVLTKKKVIEIFRRM